MSGHIVVGQSGGKTNQQPLVICNTPACHWRGQMPSGRKPRCPRCQRKLFPMAWERQG